MWLAFIGMFVPILMTLGPDFLAALRSYTWKKVPCTMVYSKVTQAPYSANTPTALHYQLHVEYNYTFEGRRYTSRRLTTGKSSGTTDPASGHHLVSQLPPGTAGTCYVNPRNPSEAVMQRGRLWMGMFLFFPFIIFGLMGHEEIFAWLEERNWCRRLTAPLPISETNDALRLDKRTLMFGVLGLAMGVFLGGFCVVGPVAQWLHSRDWVETDAVLMRSELTSRSGIHGPEYSLEVDYSYEVAGQKYHSTRRCFGGAMDEPVADLTAWAAAHKPGSSIRALVSPRDPAEAVLSRTVDLGWISLSLTLLMFCFGALMLFQCVRTRWLSRRLHGATLLTACLGTIRQTPSQLRVFPPPLVSAIGCALAALPAGAAGGWSLYKGVRALMQGNGDIINLLYGAGGCVAALCLLACAGAFFRKACHCRPILEVSPGTPSIGRAFNLRWRFVGPRRKVGWLHVVLEGFEQVKVRHLIQGYHGPISEEKKERSMFAMLPVVQQERGDALTGSVSVPVPPEMMHSFQGEKSAILWELRFEFGKDSSEKLEYRFPIQLVPAKS